MGPSDLEIFVAVAETGSLTAAADTLGSTRATVARRLAAVEEHLGATLINRTTRELALTEAGQVYLDAARRCLGNLRAAEDAVRELDGTPRGLLRIACPLIRPDHIVGPLVASYAAAHPEVDVQIHLPSEGVNPLTDGFDLAVQIGLARNASLVARCLSRETYRLVASPVYLERRGTPTSVTDLADHDCVVAVRAHRAPEPWPLTDGGSLTIERPRLQANAAGLLRMAVLADLGLGLIASSIVHADIAEGNLVPVLENEVGAEVPISLVYAQGGRVSAKVRSFVDFSTRWVSANVGRDRAASVA